MSSTNPNVSGTSTISQLAQLVTNLQNTITNVQNSNSALSNSVSNLNKYDIDNNKNLKDITDKNTTQDTKIGDLKDVDTGFGTRITTLEVKFPITILNSDININIFEVPPTTMI
jgi:hypothetical protein